MLSHQPALKIAALVAAAISIQAQTPARFDVASVKPNLLNDRIVDIRVGPGGIFAARGYTLVLLIQRAYAVMDWNVTGGPPWIRNDRFDVSAKVDVSRDLTEAEFQPMLAALLADRFRLKLHRSSKETAAYALEVARGGPKLTPAADTIEHRDTFRLTNTGLSGQAISMRDFARFFGGKLGLIAVDQTHLTGLYDFKVDWTVDPNAPADDLAVDSRSPLRAAALDALQKQLGLRIVAKKVPLDILVIDHVEKPSAAEN